MNRIARTFLVSIAALAGSCSSDSLSELVVVVDSNLSIPAEIDELVIEVRAGGETQMAGGTLVSLATTPLPRIVNLVHRGGALGPVEIHAAVLRTGTEVVARDVRTSFIEGETRVLRIALDRGCIGVSCAAGMTCDASACRSVDVPAGELLEYPDGTGPRMDDGGMCIPLTERCNGMDEDCDENVDEGIDLTSDPSNCGACMNACPVRDHATAACVDSTCGLDCQTGFDDCDGMAGNGCEADLASPLACGSCDNPCTIPGASATCTAGACAFDACLTGFDDCNADTADGCEVDLTTTPTHCGACGTVCTLPNATEGCAMSACTVMSCSAGFGDCDGMAANGCEETLRSLAHCGGCGMTCAPPNATGSCTTGSCAVMTCNPGFGNCDAMAANGCEQTLTTLMHCGMCGRTCSLANGTETCATGTCAVLMCDAGRGNCDGVDANGCETNVRTSETHCGMCGMACAPADSCISGVCR